LISGAEDAGMTLVVTSVSNLPEGRAHRRVPETLEENRPTF
jgi:hypothetical protein